jgi:hypothetical protein
LDDQRRRTTKDKIDARLMKYDITLMVGVGEDDQEIKEVVEVESNDE